YFSQGISLIVMDIVTERQANPHNEMMRVGRAPGRFPAAADAGTYAVAFPPRPRGGGAGSALWAPPLPQGAGVPPGSRGLGRGPARGVCVPVGFEATYMEACRGLRLL